MLFHILPTYSTQRDLQATSSPTPWGWIGAPAPASSAFARSRSPRPTRGAGWDFRPLRRDAPGRLTASRGSLPDLSSSVEREAAVDDLVTDVYAASSRPKQMTMWRLVVKALAKWHLTPFPPTREKIIALGAALKAGRYASAENYLSHYRVSCEREDSGYGAALQRLHLDVVRSCRRGLGAPCRALGLPLLRLGELLSPLGDPWVPGGPVGPGCAMVAGAWFLTREVELATTRACLIALELGVDGERIVRWHLPASKTDVEARGVSRAHGCSCSSSSRSLSCPYHAVLEQLERLRARFPERCLDGAFDQDLPLFPSSSGEVVTKDAMTATIVSAAERLGVPTAAPDQSARVSGHSLRVTGAQGLARAGVEVWAIQLLGRWGSSTVLEYIREVPLELSSSWAARVTKSKELDALLRDRSLPAPSGPILPLSSTSAPLRPPVDSTTVREVYSEALREARLADDVAATPAVQCRYVHSDGGKWHRLAPAGLIGSSFGWMSACGWRFGGSLASLSSELPPNLCHKLLCARCFPDLRARLKEELGN